MFRCLIVLPFIVIFLQAIMPVVALSQDNIPTLKAAPAKAKRLPKNGIVMVRGAPLGYRISDYALCPTGKKIIYNYYNVYDNNDLLFYEYDVESATSKLVFREKRRKSYLSNLRYSPDCKYLAFSGDLNYKPRSNSIDTEHLYIRDIASGKTIEVAQADPSTSDHGGDRFSGRGKYILGFNDWNELLIHTNDYNVYPANGRSDIYNTYMLFDPQTGVGRRILLGNVFHHYVTFSKDLRYIFLPNRHVSDELPQFYPRVEIYDDAGILTKKQQGYFAGVLRIDRYTGETKNFSGLGDIVRYLEDRSTSSGKILSQTYDYVSNLSTTTVSKIYASDFDNNSTEYVGEFLNNMNGFGSGYWILNDSEQYIYFLSAYHKYFQFDKRNTIDLFRYDRNTGLIDRINKPYTGRPDPKHHVYDFEVSRDGKVVMFSTLQDNMVPGDKTKLDLFVYRDR